LIYRASRAIFPSDGQCTLRNVHKPCSSVRSATVSGSETSFEMARGKKRAAAGSGSSPRGLLMILSPAKTMDLSPIGMPVSTTRPDCNAAQTAAVASAVKAAGKEKGGFAKVLGISANLASLASKYWDDFVEDPSAPSIAPSAKPALFLFDGPAFRSINASSLSEEALMYLQSNLRIIDAVHGALRPLDMVQPYRLEMATKNINDTIGKSLAKYWSPSVSKSISADLSGRNTMVVLNLASDEYAAAVDQSMLPGGTRFVKITFQQDGKVVAVHAKAARGLMARYIAKQKLEDVEGVRDFNLEGYTFVKGRSSSEEFVFDRKKPEPKKMLPLEKKVVQRSKRNSEKKKLVSNKVDEAAPKKTRRR